MPTHINDGGSTTWRTVTEFSVNDGGSTTWRTVTDAWVNDGGSTTWRKIWSNRSFLTILGLDYGGDPTLGLLRISWTTNGSMTGLTVTVDADFAGGTTYGSAVDSGLDPSTGTPYDSTLSGLSGFSTLDTTNIRLRLMDGVTVVDEITMAGPYAFA